VCVCVEMCGYRVIYSSLIYTAGLSTKVCIYVLLINLKERKKNTGSMIDNIGTCERQSIRANPTFDYSIIRILSHSCTHALMHSFTSLITPQSMINAQSNTKIDSLNS
jgi:hypothetical protein